MKIRKRGEEGAAYRYRLAALTGVLAVGLVPLFLSGAPSGAAVKHTVSASRTLPTVTMAYVSQTVDSSLPYYTLTEGLFKKYGVNVVLESLNQTAAIDAMLAGQVQFFIGAAPVVEIDEASGIPIKWVAMWEHNIDFFLIGRPGITSLSDLSGKSLAVSFAGSTTQLLAQIALQKAHVSGVHLTPVGSVPGILSAFLAGTTSAILAGPPDQTQLITRVPGASILLDLRKAFPWPGSGVAAMTPWTKTHKALTIDVMKGLIAGMASFRLHPSIAESVLSQFTGDAQLGDTNNAYLSARTIMARSNFSLVPPLDAEHVVLSTIGPLYNGASTLKAQKVVDPVYVNDAYADMKKK